VDHKTTARSTKLRPGKPRTPTRLAGNRPRAPGQPRAPGCSDAYISRLSSQPGLPKSKEEAIPVGRGAPDAYRRVPRDAPGPPWSTSNVWGDESTESSRLCSPKFPVYEIYGTTAAYNHQSRNLVVRDVRLRVRYESALSRHVRLLGHPRAGARALCQPLARARAQFVATARATAGAADARTARSMAFIGTASARARYSARTASTPRRRGCFVHLFMMGRARRRRRARCHRWGVAGVAGPRIHLSQDGLLWPSHSLRV